MLGIALKMLIGDRTKYLGLIFGVAFATVLISQQGGIFIGLLGRAASVVRDAREADLWVMDPAVTTIDQAYPLKDTALARVRGVEGVAWAVPFYKANVQVRTREGKLSSGLLLGVDDASLVGVPDEFLLGSPDDLRQPDAIALNPFGYSLLFPGRPLELGGELELNDRRAVIRGIVDASPVFSGNAIIYTRYDQAVAYTPTGRNQLTFVLGKAAAGHDPPQVARRIEAMTSLRARTSDEFANDSIMYIIRNTGIPVSFGTVVLLGIIVGIAVVALIFNQFILENLRQYAALKAIGVKNTTLIAMTMLQGLFVGAIGYGLGLGLIAMFFHVVPQKVNTFKGFYLPWQIAAAVAVVCTVIVILSALVGLRRVVFLDPAIVFRG